MKPYRSLPSRLLTCSAVAGFLANSFAAPADPYAVPTDPVQLAAAMKTAHRLRVMDATGTKPLSEFRIISGVPSGVSEQFERTHGTRAAAWQSHTIRAGSGGAMLWPFSRGYDEMILRVEADGFVTQHSDWIKKKDGPKDLVFKMVKDAGVAGVAMLPNGRPASGATVVLSTAMRDAVIDGDLGKLRATKVPEAEKLRDKWSRPRTFTVDETGRFTLPTEPDPTAAVLIVHPDAVLEMRFVDFQKTPRVTLQPWGRLQGRVQWGEKAGAAESVSLSVHRDDYGYPGIVAQYAETKTDEKGQFVFENVLPGLVQLSVPIKFAEKTEGGVSAVNLPGRTAHVTVKAGEPLPVLLGGRGRTVRGKLTGRDKWDGVTFHFHPTAPRIGLSGDNTIWSAWQQFKDSAIGPVFFRNDLKVTADGAFEIPRVPPGSYQIFFHNADGKGDVANGQFTVPAEKQDAEPEPLDAGEFRARS